MDVCLWEQHTNKYIISLATGQQWKLSAYENPLGYKGAKRHGGHNILWSSGRVSKETAATKRDLL